MSQRSSLLRVAFVFALPLVLACAGAGPRVLTNTPDEVAIEFPKNGDLGAATELADTECAKHGRIARFGVVKTAATPTTRVAKYRCVTPNVAAATQPASVGTPPVSAPPPAKPTPAKPDATTPAPLAAPVIVSPSSP